ncbi:MAG: hypothetical protein ACPGYV_10895, partial [Phycisphaeraceae bacterium]
YAKFRVTDTAKYYTATNGGGDEPWDFPWTNPQQLGRTAELNDGTTVPVFGGVMDDSWIADGAPDFGPAPAAGTAYAGGGSDPVNGVWRKITNLGGIYLGGTGGTADLSTQDVPNEYPVNNNADVLYRDINHNPSIGRLVDADGDGIGDSRWEWAPIRQIGGTQYVVAARIIDLSARMDANVALGATPTNNTFNNANLSTDDPRGDGPTELDAGAFVSTFANQVGVAMNTAHDEWRKAVGFRLTGDDATTGITATPGVLRYDGNQANPAIGTRREYWQQGASRVSNRFVRNDDPAVGAPYDYGQGSTFGLEDAFELLQNNGLNTANTTALENLMPNLLRGTNTAEDTFNTVAAVTANNWSQRNFWELDPRKHLSMFTGSSIAAKPSAIGRPHGLKLDVNEAVRTSAGRTALRDRIDAFLTDVDNDGALLALYPHLTSRDELAEQLTANLTDYIDRDNRLTFVGGQTGFEALPHITEVYIQRPFQVTNVVTDPDGTGDTNLKRVEWRNLTGTNGYAIEIGNPFGRFVGGTWVGRTISLENVWLKIDTAAAENLVDDLGAPTELAPGEVLIVYRNSTNGVAPNDDLEPLWATPAGNLTVRAAVTSTTFMDRGITPVTLHAEDQENPGAALTWHYSGCEVLVPVGPIEEDLTSADGDFATVTNGDGSYVQTNFRGIGQGLRMMTVHPESQGADSNPRGFAESIDTFTTPSLNREDTAGTAQRTALTPEFGAEAKTGASTQFATLADQQIVWPDSPRERLHWIGDLLQIPLIGPSRGAADNGSTIAQAFEDANLSASAQGIADLLLPYQRYSGATVAPVANATAGNGAFNVPHALLLLEQLTTFNPATDGHDGDDQGDSAGESPTTPDEDEVLVPGKLNLNTASFDTLVRLLPFPDQTTRTQVANAIITRRESITQGTDFGVGINALPGIAYTGALYEQIENLGENPSQVAGDNIDLNGNGVRIDLNDYETTLGTYDAEDGVADDREEEIMIAKWLSEVADNRSDVFAAYIVVQGYPAGAFTTGAVESARLIVIFSRANVQGAGDRAVEIGRLRIQ